MQRVRCKNKGSISSEPDLTQQHHRLLDKCAESTERSVNLARHTNTCPLRSPRPASTMPYHVCSECNMESMVLSYGYRRGGRHEDVTTTVTSTPVSPCSTIEQHNTPTKTSRHASYYNNIIVCRRAGVNTSAGIRRRALSKGASKQMVPVDIRVAIRASTVAYRHGAPAASPSLQTIAFKYSNEEGWVHGSALGTPGSIKVVVSWEG